MPQFTKGKWYAGMEDKYGPYVYAVNGKGDTIIAIIRSSTYSSDQFSDDEVIAIKKANAHLTAEAPTMYKLLNQAFKALPDDHPLRYDIDACLCHVEGVPVPGDEDKYPDCNENSPMILDEAIQHALDIAENHGACAENHRQLAGWLIELKNLKERNRD